MREKVISSNTNLVFTNTQNQISTNKKTTFSRDVDVLGNTIFKGSNLITAVNGDTYNLQTPTNGEMGYVLTTDGSGSTMWSPGAMIESGIIYTGSLPIPAGKHVIINEFGTAVSQSRITEIGSYLNIDNLNIANCNEMHSSVVFAGTIKNAASPLIFDTTSDIVILNQAVRTTKPVFTLSDEFVSKKYVDDNITANYQNFQSVYNVSYAAENPIHINMNLGDIKYKYGASTIFKIHSDILANSYVTFYTGKATNIFTTTLNTANITASGATINFGLDSTLINISGNKIENNKLYTNDVMVTGYPFGLSEFYTNIGLSLTNIIGEIETLQLQTINISAVFNTTTVAGTLVSDTLIKQGGTANQILMANGSTTNISNYVLKTGDSTISGSLTANSFIQSGGSDQQYLMADGSVSSISSIGSNIYIYKFNNLMTPPPSSGHVNFNASAFASATHIYISHLTSDDTDIDPFFPSIQAGNIIYIQNKDDSTNWVRYNITSTAITANSYIDITATYNNSLGAFFQNNSNIYFSIFSTATLPNYTFVNLGAGPGYVLAPSSTSIDIKYREIIANSGMSIAVNATSITITNTLPSTLISLSTLGGGTSLISSGANPAFKLNSLAVSMGLSIALASDLITITNTLPSTLISLATLGGGTSLISSGTNPAFKLNSLAVSTGLSIALASDLITITNTLPSTLISLATLGGGTSLISSGANPAFKLNSLAVSTGLSIALASDLITITNTLPFSPADAASLSSVVTKTQYQSAASNITTFTGTLTATNISLTPNVANILLGNGTTIQQYTLTNAGTITYQLVASTSTGSALKIKALTTGSNITLANSGDDVQISSFSAGFPFNIPSNGTTLTTTGSRQYYYQVCVPCKTTISGIRVYANTNTSDTFRIGIYRGYVKGANSATLVGQTASIPFTLQLPYTSATINPITNLNFAQGEMMVIGFHTLGTTSTLYYSTGVSNPDFAFSGSVNYTSGGFPSALSSGAISANLTINLCFILT